MALSRGFIQNAATTPLDARLMESGRLIRSADNTTRTGMLFGTASAVSSTSATTPMTVLVADKTVFVVSRGVGDGATITQNVGAASVTIPAAPSSNSRYDAVWVKHDDDTQGDADALPVFGVTSGTAAASPTVPAVPTGALLLATVLVPTGVTATNASGVVITNVYPFTALTGGRIRYRTVAALKADAANVMNGSVGYVANNGIFYLRNGVWLRVDQAYIGQQIGGDTLASSGSASRVTEVSVSTVDTDVIDAGAVGLYARVAGWYFVSANANFSTNAAGNRTLEIMQNAASMTTGLADTRYSGSGSLSASGLVHCAANDTFGLYLSQSSGSALVYTSRLSMQLVSAD